MAPHSKLTSDMLADLEVPHEVRLSPTAKQVVYSLRSVWNRPRGRWVSSLWLAEVGKQYSTRQITAGDSLDTWPQWSADGKSIAYMSDQGKEGITAIWMLDVAGGGKPVALTSTDCEKAITQFAWSGDGKYIAYLSADEKTAEMKRKEERKEDAIVYGQYQEYARLRVIEVATKKVTTLVSEDFHVYQFAWSPDSKSIAYVSQGLPEYEAHLVSGSTIRTSQLDGQDISELETILGFVEDFHWVQEDLWFISKYSMEYNNSSKVVYKMSLAEKKSKRYAYGEVDCASAWAFPPSLVKASETELVVKVQSGLHDQFQMVVDGTKLYDKITEIRAWDVILADGQSTLIIVESTAAKPSEVYSIVDDETVCLSDHGKEVAEVEVATAEPFYAEARDGTKLDAVLIIPKGYDAPKPWPTIVMPHGGPYTRTSIAFDLPNFNWSPWFASLGYVTLCPNYRGGSSHGEAFTATVRENAGGYVYTDTVDITKAAVTAGIVDANRVGIAGWSYGGIISYLAVTRDSDFHFNAAMCGAGDSDWDSCIMSSSGWRSAIHVAGRAPWAVDIKDTHNREASALWYMKDIKSTAVLILHGENDEIVPLSQAKAFYYGCQHYGVPCEMVVYPREGHGVFPPLERAHYIDMLERMGIFFGKHVLNPSE